MYCLRTPQSLKLPLLEHPQQLDLQVDRHVPDFVQKHGAAFGLFEAPDTVVNGPREGALDVAEQLGLQQVLGQRAAVDGHQRPPRARPRQVHRSGHHLLSRAGFTADEDRAAAGPHQPDDVHHVAHRPAFAHQQAPPGLDGGRVLEFAPAGLLNRHFQAARQLLVVERFATKIVCAHPTQPKRILGGPAGLLDQDRNPRIDSLDFFEQLGRRPLRDRETG